MSPLVRNKSQATKGRTSRGTPSTMRPFFGFYGGKWRDAPKYYPVPEYDTIVEPFAGSAGYSVRYGDRNVVLGEKDDIIFGVWDYLIRASTMRHTRYSRPCTGADSCGPPNLPGGPMARWILAEPWSVTPADRAIFVDARWHPSRVFLGRTGAPDNRLPS